MTVHVVRLPTLTPHGCRPRTSDPLLLTRYQKGQFYNTHHDNGHDEMSRACGPRFIGLHAAYRATQSLYPPRPPPSRAPCGSIVLHLCG